MKHRWYLLSVLALLEGNFQAQNFIDRYLSNPVVFTTIASSVQGVNAPTDLDFRPGSNELWVSNRGDGNGSSMVIVYNAGKTNQSSQFRKDSHSSHFMVFGSSFAFSDIGQWAGVSEIKNTSDPSSTFMGPALWSADTSIFARVFQSNWQSGFPLGSHLSMLHQSPFSMGIAHDTLRAYWVFDGWNGNLCKYDFTAGHGPGYEDHSDGKIFRYTDVSLTRVPNIPSHLVLDKTSKWLYIVNGGPKQLLRVNTSTGTLGAFLNVPPTAGELLTVYRSVTGATKQTLATYTSQPCGIDVANNRLVVGDYDTGEIRIYNTAVATPTLMGVLATGQPGLTGLRIGSDGKIWFVNMLQNNVVRIDVSAAANDAAVNAIVSPQAQLQHKNYHAPYFNHCGASVLPQIQLHNSGSAALTSLVLESRLDNGPATTFTWTGNLAPDASVNVTLPSMPVTDGEHELKINSVLPNGQPDENPLNDVKAVSFRVKASTVTAPFFEDFTSGQFPPPGWSYMGHNKYCKMSHNATLGSFGVGAGCLQMDNTSGQMDISGQVDYFMSPKIDMSNSTSGTVLRFDVAYAQYNSSSNDRLEVLASTNCGATWNSIYNLAGEFLATAGATTGVFVPEWYDWRRDVVYLNNYIGQPEVLFLFKTTSNFGNNLYLDSIGVVKVTDVGLQEQSEALSLKVFPNPASNDFQVQASSPIERVLVHSVTGTLVKDEQPPQQQVQVSMPTAGLAPGVYVVTVYTQRGTAVKKLVVAGS